MPSLPVRRTRELTESESESDSEYPSSRVSPLPDPKRARRDTTATIRATPAYGARNSNGIVNGGEDEDSDDAPEVHQPGAIVRVKLKNFVTYTEAEFFPGPSFNMIIGPNGTGKSTFVCAICLGLGYGSQHLGRAKEVGEFVKQGTQEGEIEIELEKADPNDEMNPVIRRRIIKDGNKSIYSINGRTCPQKEVQSLVRSLHIQIDNLCQFLPQDKVVEFSRLSPVELLESTLQAAAVPEMTQFYEDLKKIRREQKHIEEKNDANKESLKQMTERQQVAMQDVERQRERDAINTRILGLELARPFPKYRLARNEALAAKERRKEVERELAELKREVQPRLNALERKKEYRDAMKRAAEDRRKRFETADKAVAEIKNRKDRMSAEYDELQKEDDAEKDAEEKRKEAIKMLKAQIEKLDKRIANERPAPFDPSELNAKIRTLKSQQSECREKGVEKREEGRSFVEQANEMKKKAESKKNYLESLDSEQGKKLEMMRKASKEVFTAWEWLQKNQDKFQQRVYGPPIIECSIKDIRYSKVIESMLQKDDFLSFTCQSQQDNEKLQDYLINELRLAEISYRTVKKHLSEFRPPAVSKEQLRRMGLDGWALDYIDGPEPVLAMLCSGADFHRKAVGLEEGNDEQYEMIARSPIMVWATGSTNYTITRRADLGPNATSSRTKSVKPAQVFVSQGVDPALKARTQDEIDEFMRGYDIAKEKLDEVKAAIEVFKTESADLEEQIKDLEEDKAEQEKIQREYMSLEPRKESWDTKLQGKLQESKDSSEQREKIQNKQTKNLLDQAKIAAAFAEAVEQLVDAHEEHLKLQVMVIEAESEVDSIKKRSEDVQKMLEDKTTETQELVDKYRKQNAEARELLKQCIEISEDDSIPQERRDIATTLAETITPQELDDEIAAERARLEGYHVGNPGAIRDYETRQRKIDELTKKVAEATKELEEANRSIIEIRGKFEPELDDIVAQISDNFSESFQTINCVGEVRVHKEVDFDQWSIEILVKFREEAPLQVLDSHRQSGGERAVSTIFYLMAMQSLAKAPFRVVDEINQGMDRHNERKVHERMVHIACEQNRSQYFLITPKLLHDLEYHPRMTVHIIASGEYMPKRQALCDFDLAIGKQRALRAAA